MAYDRTYWENREVEKPRTYTMTDNPDGTVTLNTAEGQVFVAGTPIVAENMNKIEDQLVISDNHVNDFANPHGVTASQIGAYTKTESDGRYEPINTAYTKSESDGRYEYKDTAYTKSESDNLYQPKIATPVGVQLYQREVKAYSAGGWRNIYFDSYKNLNGADHLMGYGVSVDVGSYYLITASLSIGNLSTTSGYVLMRVSTGDDIWRLDGKHFDQNGNLSLTGSVIDFVPAGNEIRLYAYSESNFSTIGDTSEFRGFMNVRQLI
jgi:hypothetical protein